MNKSDLAKIIIEKTDLRPEQSEDLISVVLSQMEKALVEKNRIEIRGFGSFSTKEYKARWGRNPKTGDKIWVDEKHLPVFKLGKELKDRLNNENS